MIYFSNINSFNDNIEEFVIAKNKVDTYLISKNQREAKTSVSEFLTLLKMNNVLVYKSNTHIPYQIFNVLNKDVVVFYSDATNNEEAVKFFKNNITNIIDNKLKKRDLSELVSDTSLMTTYVLIGSDVYTLL